jgi:hypothetical protein
MLKFSNTYNFLTKKLFLKETKESDERVGPFVEMGMLKIN